MFIHLVVIAWLYVAVMMAVAEATNTNGTVLGAIFTFLLYGLLPVALVVYLLSTPARRRALKEREAAARDAAVRSPSAPGASGDAPGGASAGGKNDSPPPDEPPHGAAMDAAADSGAPDQRREAPAGGAVTPVRKEP